MKNRFLTLILFLFACIPLFSAELEDYFKKMSDKSGNHQMRNIDFIYMINLDERPEKFHVTVEKLAPFGIYPCRFSAVNGWRLSLEALNDMGVKYGPWMSSGGWGTYYPLDENGQPKHELIETFGRNYFCHCMSRGAIGICLSHLSVLQDAYDAGYETIWVMEDDVEVMRDPRVLSDLIDELDDLVGREGWDVLFTDRDTKNNNGQYVACSAYAWRPNFVPANPLKCLEKENISPDFRKVGARFGAYSMIVRRSGIEKILDFFKCFQLFLPYDIDFTLPFDMRFYTVLDDVVGPQINAFSDNGAPNYRKKFVGEEEEEEDDEDDEEKN
ncbi:MAG: glycosyltransferase family 25 protein [Chlamydiales bacterium]